MSKTIDYYFTSISPFTYFGHSHLLQIAEEANASVRFKPVMLRQVFAITGTLPIHERPKCRQAYRLVEIERWAAKRQLPVNLHPAHFPTDPSLADKCIIALQEMGINAGEFAGLAQAACWSQEQDIAVEAVLHTILTELKLNADAVINQAKTEQTHAIYEANTADAIEQGAIGAPAYYYNGEQFWGQDRLELLKDALI